jgi:2-methylcitrate dehydratase PrpD
VYFTHSDGGTPEAALAGLGQRWELEDVWLTLWPLALLVRNVVNAVLDVVVETDTRPGDVASVDLALSPRAYELYGTMDFGTKPRAKTSPRYLTAVVLHDRQCGAEQFSAERMSDPSVVEFARDRVAVRCDPALDERAVRVTIVRRDGHRHSHYRPVAHGDAADPLSRAEIAEKFRKAATPVLSQVRATEVVEFVEHLESQPTVQPLLDALRRP